MLNIRIGLSETHLAIEAHSKFSIQNSKFFINYGTILQIVAVLLTQVGTFNFKKKPPQNQSEWPVFYSNETD